MQLTLPDELVWVNDPRETFTGQLEVVNGIKHHEGFPIIMVTNNNKPAYELWCNNKCRASYSLAPATYGFVWARNTYWAQEIKTAVGTKGVGYGR